MTAITSGINGTLKSTSAEATFVELVVFLRKHERLLANNPSGNSYVSIDFSGTAFLANISYRIPVNTTIDSNGSLVLTANEYLQNLNFSIGIDGTFKSTNAAQALIEIASYLQAKEANPTSNPNERNFISSQFNADEGLLAGTATLPINLIIDEDGQIKIEAIEYLN